MLLYARVMLIRNGTTDKYEIMHATGHQKHQEVTPHSSCCVLYDDDEFII